MLVAVGQLADAWAEITGQAARTDSATTATSQKTSSAPVHIFAAAVDCDAVAAITTVTALLREDSVTYTVTPVETYHQLADSFRAAARADASQRPRAILCVNCGARANLEQLFLGDHDDGQDDDEIQHDSDTHSVDDAEIHDFDGSEDDNPLVGSQVTGRTARRAMRRRRVIRAALFSMPIYVLDSQRPYHLGNIESNHVKVLHDDTTVLNRYPLMGFENVYGYVDPSSDDEPDDFTGNTATHAPEHSPTDADSDEENLPARNASGTPRNDRQRKRDKKNQNAARDYYSQTYRGESSAFLAHMLANSLNKASTSTLWAAIVGTTDQFLLQRIRTSTYDKVVRSVRGELVLVNPVVHASTNPDEAFTGDDQATQDASKTIVSTRELRLDMLRHWSLFESISHSSYVCARIASWKKTGSNRISEILAQLGISKHEADQKWTYMSHRCKSLLEDIQEVLDNYSISDIEFDSFVKHRSGYKGQISAADVVFATNALLELGSCGSEEEKSDRREAMSSRFWSAYDLVNGCQKSIDQGLDLAMHVQRFLVQEAHEIMERDRYIPSGSFRYVVLRDNEHKLGMAQPLVLTRLALFLMDALRAQEKKHKPFVVLAPSRSRGQWIAVAVPGLGARNNFSHKFRLAAQATRATLTADAFDSSVAEINDGAEKEFIRYLHTILG